MTPTPQNWEGHSRVTYTVHCIHCVLYDPHPPELGGPQQGDLHCPVLPAPVPVAHLLHGSGLCKVLQAARDSLRENVAVVNTTNWGKKFNNSIMMSASITIKCPGLDFWCWVSGGF